MNSLSAGSLDIEQSHDSHAISYRSSGIIVDIDNERLKFQSAKEMNQVTYVIINSDMKLSKKSDKTY